MCIDALFGDSGGSESGPVWKSPDSNLVNNILLSAIFSKFPKSALAPMLNSSDSGLGSYLDRVYGSGSKEGSSGPDNTNIMLQGGINGMRAPQSIFGDPAEAYRKTQAERANQVSTSRNEALNNLDKFNTGNYNDRRPGMGGYDILSGKYRPAWLDKGFSGYNRTNSKYKLF